MICFLRNLVGTLFGQLLRSLFEVFSVILRFHSKIGIKMTPCWCHVGERCSRIVFGVFKERSQNDHKVSETFRERSKNILRELWSHSRKSEDRHKGQKQALKSLHPKRRFNLTSCWPLNSKINCWHQDVLKTLHAALSRKKSCIQRL